MESAIDNAIIFKKRYKLILLNGLYIFLLMMFIGLFMKGTFVFNVIVALSIVLISFISITFPKNLSYIKFHDETKQVEMCFSGIFVTQPKLTLNAENMLYSYKEEIVGRGIKRPVFRLYYADKEPIIK
jgi:hypothetical protein